MESKPLFQKAVPIILVPLAGFFLLNFAFAVNYVVHLLVGWVVSLFAPPNPGLPYVSHVLFLLLVTAVSWLIFKTKLPDLVKAIYCVLPTAVVLVSAGIFLYPWPGLVYTVGALLSGAAVIYLYATKRPWIYYYAVILVTLALLITGLMGMEI